MEGHRKQDACTLVLPVSLVSLQRAQIFEYSSNVTTCWDFGRRANGLLKNELVLCA